jgi:hypothetical protein
MKALQFFALIALALGTVTCTQRKEAAPAQSHKRVIHVQGHPHELLTRLHAEGTLKAPEQQPSVKGSTSNIIPTDVTCWAGDSNLPDSAYLLVKFTDGKQANNILLWGYHFDASQNKTSLDMIQAVAETDSRFLVLLQNANSMYGYTVGGIGYNYKTTCGRVPVWFDYDSAVIDSAHIMFRYTSPAVVPSQNSFPDNPPTEAEEAIEEAISGAGIIVHPYDIRYGYAAYDYDWWKLGEESNDYEWQAGWYQGYWTFYTKNQLNGGYAYSGVGVSGRTLANSFVDGFVFSSISATANMSGNYVPANCSCVGSTGKKK